MALHAARVHICDGLHPLQAAASFEGCAMGKNTVVAVTLLMIPASPMPANARGGHGHGGLVGYGMHSGEGTAVYDADRRRAFEEYTKAVSEEEGRLLKKLKSICRGC
jgi:hypothetical protein